MVATDSDQDRARPVDPVRIDLVRRKGDGSNGPHGKIAVIGAIARKGNVVAQIIEKVNAETLQGFVKQAVGENVSLVATDEHTGYKGLSKSGYFIKR